MHDPKKQGRGEAEINSVHIPRFCLSLNNALKTLPVGYATTFYTGRLQTLTLVYTISDKKGTPFVYLFVDKCYLFHIPSITPLHSF